MFREVTNKWRCYDQMTNDNLEFFTCLFVDDCFKPATEDFEKRTEWKLQKYDPNAESKNLSLDQYIFSYRILRYV